MDKAIRPILGLALFAVLFVALIALMRDYDIFYHLAIGREIAQQGAIPATEFYLYPKEGEATTFHEWGFALLAYGVFAFGGYMLLTLANAAIGAGTLSLLWAAARPGGDNGPGPATVIAFLALSAIVADRLIYRPEMAFLFALSLTILVWERYLAKRGFGLLFSLPVIAFVLAQMHPSGALLFGVMGAYGIQALLTTEKPARPKLFGKLAGLGVATLLAYLINPYGLSQLTVAFEFAGQADMLATNPEFLPVLQTAQLPLFACLCALAIYSLVRSGEFRAVDVILMLAFAWLAWIHVRNLAPFAIVVMVPMLRAMAVMDQTISARRRDKVVVGCIAAAIAIGLVVLPAWRGLWGFGPHPGIFPLKLTEDLKQQADQGRLFNGYGMGGWFAWSLYPSGQKIFIDGRHYEITQSFLDYQDVVFADPRWETVLDTYKVQRIAIKTVAHVTAEVFPVVHKLVQSPNWRFVSVDSGVALFVRDQDVPAGQGMAEIAAGIHQLLKVRSGPLGLAAPARVTEAQAWLWQGQPDKARAAIAELEVIYPNKVQEEPIKSRLAQLKTRLDGQAAISTPSPAEQAASPAELPAQPTPAEANPAEANPADSIAPAPQPANTESTP